MKEQDAAHSDKEKIYIDGDFNDSYEARVKRATGKNTIISKAELNELKAELTRLRSELQQEREWISVDDRLPEERMLHVLAFNGTAPEYNQHVFHAVWFEERRNFKSVQDGYNYMGMITHWKPLPEPPKKPS